MDIQKVRDMDDENGWYELVFSSKRAFIVTEDPNGSFTYEAFATHAAARDAWTVLEQDWKEWVSSSTPEDTGHPGEGKTQFGHDVGHTLDVPTHVEILPAYTPSDFEGIPR